MEVTEHYPAEKFGSPQIDAQTDGVRILDLIRSREKSPDPLPLSPAAAKVIDALESLGDRLKLYQVTGTDWARQISLTRPVAVLVQQRRETYEEAAIRQRRQQAKSGNSWGDWSEVSPSSLRQVTERETRQVAWLATMRQKLVGVSNRKGLDDSELVRLVIPRRLANDLFGCGPVLSWYEEQPAPFPLTGPGLYPPPELQGIRPHDSDRWGEQLTEEARPRVVVRVADLVQFVADQSGMRAVRPMAAKVLDAMAGSAPTMYLLNQGDLAGVLDPGHVWRCRYPSGAERRREWQKIVDDARHDYVVVGGFAEPMAELDEAEARGVAIQEKDRAMGGIYSQDDWPELPELTGAAGALQWARVQWVERARTFSDLDAGDLGRLAVPLVWAVAKFGRQAQLSKTGQLEEPAEQPPAELLHRAAPAPLTIVADVPARRTAADRDAREKRARHEFKRTKEPGEIWAQADLAALLWQFEELTRRGAGALKSADAHSLLSEIWGMGSPNTAKTYLTKARESCQAGRQARSG